ncbi:hypothetical protein OGAPHI_000523 [Ogataea philodendri]|uniref:Chloride channel protein n=1 Tax=Ogataea philodendri TaxID=1378263 RepID=A0A9P8TAF9_9ASCO|nr:uncharacterized protein OGAPHI_000523 [Ogataea philodendri]KAH3671300.1 hypothetical protein OGAPHI_000523 [Ogataea philodendri]
MEQVSLSRPYGPFELIDWEHEYQLNSDFQKRRLQSSNRFQQFIYTNQRWLLLIGASIIMALLTIAIDYSSMFLHGLRSGVCKSNVLTPAYECDDLADWSTFFLFFTDSTMLRKINDFIVYLTNVLILTLFGSLLATKHKYIARGGIPEVKLFLSGANIPGFLQPSAIASKVLSLVLILSGGLFLGLEGPLVHISMGVLDFLITKFSPTKNEAIRRELLSSTVAIGIGLAFNAPIGGVLFALEQIQSAFPVDKMMWNAFVCSTVGVTVLQKLHPYMKMDIDEMFTVSWKNNWLSWETVPYMFLGLLCGVLGVIFSKLNIYFATFRKTRLDNPKLKVVEVIVVSVLGAVVGYFSKYSMFSLPKMLQQLFDNCADTSANLLCPKESEIPYGLFTLLLAGTVQSFILSSYTYGCNVPGGLLLPCLIIGGSVGRLVGLLLQTIQNEVVTSALHIQCLNEKKCISVASYAVVGAGSFAAAVFKMNVTMVVILFELTGAVTYMIPIMMGVFCARFLNDMLIDMSIYELWLENAEMPYLAPNIEDRLTHPEYAITNCDMQMLSIEEFASLTDDGTLTLNDIERLPEQQGYPVVRNDDLVGYISSFSLRSELAKLKADNIVSFDSVVTFDHSKYGCHSLQALMVDLSLLQIVNGDTKFLTACQMMDQLWLECVFVCWQGSHKLRGIIYRDKVEN